MRDEESSQTRPVFIDEEWHSMKPSPEARRKLERMFRRSRSLLPPPGMTNGEQYRAWLLEQVETHGTADETSAEQAETRKWRARVLAATVEELWNEYKSLGRVRLVTAEDQA